MSNTQLLHFVLQASQPRYLSKDAEEAAAPDFVRDASVWRKVFTLAKSLGLLLPLCVVLSRASWKTEIPDAVRFELDRMMKNELISMAVLENEFENVLRRLIENKVQVIILGGSILQKDCDPQQVFKAVRSFDLLIPKEMMSTAQRAVGHMGYRLSEAEHHLGGIGLQRKLQSAVSGQNVVSGIRFRWRILEEDAEHDASAIWERAVSEVSAEFPMGLKAMIPEDRLVQLIRHGLIERLLDSPVILHEMDQLIRLNPQLDWARVLFMLERTQSQSAGAFAAILLTRFWSSPIPQKIIDSLLGNMGAMKRRMIMKMAQLEDWFSPQERDFTFHAKAFFLLSDRPASAIKATFQSRRHSVA